MTWQEALAANKGVVQCCDVPPNTLSRLAATGLLVRLFPGTYVAPKPKVETIYEAMIRWDPNAILVGAGAARLSFWSQCPLPYVEIATQRARQLLRCAPNIRLTARNVPADLVALRLTTPPLTALDLVEVVGIAGICHALRTGAATSEQLHCALRQTARRPGHRKRRSALLAAESKPWSPLEAKLHAILRKRKIVGWVANQLVRVGRHCYFGDVVFPAERVIIEVDGWEHHRSQQSFMADRRRHAEISLAGWFILRLTHADLTDTRYVVACVRKALKWCKAV